MGVVTMQNTESQAPKGYKKTDVGLIPVDWEVETLFGKVHFQVGYPFSSDFFNEEGKGIRLVKNRDLKNDDRVYYFSGTYQDAFIVRNGDILVGMDGDFVPCFWNKGTALLNQRVGRVLCQPCLDSKFLYFMIRKPLENLQNATSATTVKHLSHGDIENLQCAIPPLEEQQAIAQVLTNMDDYIHSLQQLVEKKKNIKQGTMQQLLTGRTRLPGFGGKDVGTKKTDVGVIPVDWEVKTFGEVFHFLSTSSHSRAELSVDSDVHCIHYGDIHTQLEHFLDFNFFHPTMLPTSKASKYAFIKDGDLVMADASEDYSGIGKCVEIKNIGERTAISGLHTFLLRDKEPIFAKGFKGFFHSNALIKKQLDTFATGLKVYGVSKGNLAKVLIPIPPLEEQRAITQVLTNMDDEITALQEKIEKAKQVKQGAMQELLTGKRRLV